MRLTKKNFIEIYDRTEESKKLNFLKQLLLKDSDLQNQFMEFTTNKNNNLDTITAINIDELRDEIWNKISAIDVDEEVESSCEYYNYDDDGIVGDEILESIFNPYVDKALSFIDKGNYLDAFRSILAIYELRVVEAPEVEDDNYYVFGEDIESHIEDFILSSIASFNIQIEKKVLSVKIINSLITLFFERYVKYLESSDKSEYYYNISHFNYFFELLVDKFENAKYLLEKIKAYNLDDDYTNSANIILHCADIMEDNELYLSIANEFFMYDKEVALKLQKRYKELNISDELARVSQMLFEKDDNTEYALFVIENIDKQIYEELYIIALQIYVKAKHSLKHYELLREYFDKDKRLKFIKDLDYGYNELFYIQLLETEKQYKAILDFVEKNIYSYQLEELVKPIITVYPNEVFKILKARCDKFVEKRGRSAYTKASKLLQLMLNVPQTKEALKAYVNELYNYQPRLPALRDELSKARLLLL